MSNDVNMTTPSFSSFMISATCSIKLSTLGFWYLSFWMASFRDLASSAILTELSFFDSFDHGLYKDFVVDLLHLPDVAYFQLFLDFRFHCLLLLKGNSASLLLSYFGILLELKFNFKSFYFPVSRKFCFIVSISFLSEILLIMFVYSQFPLASPTLKLNCVSQSRPINDRLPSSVMNVLVLWFSHLDVYRREPKKIQRFVVVIYIQLCFR